ncbi:MAG: response regulator transcription factor [Actinomycetota bacterium]|nr:response regulator transcription factor [Actinomycetota bacterium]
MLTEPDKMAKLVVCEDDRATLELLSDHLTADRYEVLAAPTAADALRLCEYNSPDLLLLDLSLPDASGLDVLREIREPDRSVSRFESGIGVIILSGRSTERDRVRGLEQGADDYVVKPYSYGEHLARITAVLRRKSGDRGDLVKAGGIVINRVERSVRVGDRPVDLSTKEYALLGALVKEPTRVYSKEELLRDVWGYRSLGHTRTLEAHASRLRRKLDPDEGRYVVNCWGVGYRLVAP